MDGNRTAWRRLIAAALLGGAVGGGFALSRVDRAGPSETAAAETPPAQSPVAGTTTAEPPIAAPVPAPLPTALASTPLLPQAPPADPRPPMSVAPASGFVPAMVPPPVVPVIPAPPEVAPPAAVAPPPMTVAPPALPVVPPPRSITPAPPTAGTPTVPVYRPSDPQPLFPLPVETAPPSLPEAKPAGKPESPIPSLPSLAPPAPPANLTGLPKPLPPADPDFNLRPGDTGHSVKMDGTAGVVKMQQTPFAASQKFEFLIPSATDSLATAPGETPMILKQTVLATVLGGAIAFAPASAPAAFPVPPLPMAPVAADPVQKTVDERVKDIEKQLTEIVEMLKGKKDSQGFPLPTDPGLAEEVKRLKDEVAALRKQIDEMKKTTALRPDPADPMAGKGTVRVVNEYPVQIAIVINDKSYRVESNTKVDITVPAGEFSYQLLNSGSSLTPIKSTLKEKEVVTLRIK